MQVCHVISEIGTVRIIQLEIIEKKHAELCMQAHMHADRHPADINMQQQLEKPKVLQIEMAHRALQPFCLKGIRWCTSNKRAYKSCTMPQTRDS